MPALQEQLTISIATKDRPVVLDATLRRIHAFGLGHCPLIICDDGSSPALALSSLSLFPENRLIRNEKSQGQAGARNRIAEECRTPYLLQLDDDSYPVEGDLQTLCVLAGKSSDWLAIALPFKEPARGRNFPAGIPVDQWIPVSAFVGCSALIHAERFRKIGGYAPWIGGMAEEDEICLRALASGYSVLTIDQVRVQHDVTETSRSPDRITIRSIRNWLLLWVAHAPLIVLPWRLLRLLAGSVVLAIRQKKLAAIRGFLEGLVAVFKTRPARNAVSMTVYRRFRELPHSLDFFKS